MHKSRRIQRHKKTGNLCSYALLTCALVLAGCGQQQKKSIADSNSLPDIDAGEAMEVAEDVLAKMHFAIDKADVSTGYIRTRPLPGAQFFEFWRSDNVGSENSFLANFHTIRRTVELNMNRRQGQLEIDCDVRIQRLSLPERETFSAARAYGMYTRSGPTLQKLRFSTEQIKGIEWIDLDKDEKLAAEIVKRITERIARRSSNDSRTAESRT
jgi:hypothetical protein